MSKNKKPIDKLLYIILGTILVFGLTHIFMALYRESNPVLAEIPMFVPMLYSFGALAALCIVILSLGRYRVLKDAVSFWTGIAFINVFISNIFFILNWPGLRADGDSIIGNIPGTSGWILSVSTALTGIFLLTGGLVQSSTSKPRNGKPSNLAVAGWASSIILLYILLIVFESYLPVLVADNGAFTTLVTIAMIVLCLIFGAGAFFMIRQYLRTKDRFTGFVALAQILIFYCCLEQIMFDKRYAALWYTSRIQTVMAYLIILFGLVYEYVQLYRREEKKSRQLLESERKTSEILTSITDCHYNIDKDWRLIQINDKALKYFGFNREAILGKNYWDIFPVTKGTFIENNFRKAVSQNVTMNFEFHSFIRDSWAEMHVYPFAEGLSVNFSDITERKLAEEALRASEERFKLSMEATQDGLWDWNIITDEAYFSPAYYYMLGYEPGDFPGSGRSWMDMIHPDDFSNTLHVNMDCISGKTEFFESEYRMKSKNGDWRWILSRGKCVERDEKGSGLRLVGTQVNITERKRLEQERNFLAEMLAHANDAIIVVDKSYSIIHWNKGAELMYDYTEAEARGNTLGGLLMVEYLQTGAEKIIEELKHNKTTKCTISARRKNGTQLIADVNISGVEETLGNTSGYVVIHRDITERKKAQEALAESEKRAWHLIKYAPTAIYEIDFRSKKIVTLNEAMVLLSGYSREELLSMEISEILDEESNIAFLSRMEKMLKGEKPDDQVEYKIKAKDGRIIYALLNVKFNLDERGVPVGALVVGHDITERKSMEQQLRFQADILQSVTDAVIVTDLSYNITSWNKPAERMYGWVAKEVMGRFIKDIVQTQTDGETLTKIYQVAKDGQTIISEHIQKSKDGNLIHVECNSMALLDSEGKNIGYVTINRNITERKKFEQQSQQSEKKYKDLLANAKSIIVSVDTKGVFTFINEYAEDFFGFKQEELLGKSVSETIVPKIESTGRIMDELLDEIYKDPDKYNISINENIKKNGDRVWIEWHNKSLFDSNGNRTGHLAVGTDITDRKKAEDAIAASEYEFRLLTESMPQIVWTTTADGLNTYFNHKWVEYTGLTLEESYGHGWNKPFHPDDQQRAWDAWQNAVQHNAAYLLQCRLRRFDGVYRWWLIHGVPVVDKNGTISKWYGTCTDIDEMKNAGDAILHNEQLLNSVIENVSSGVALIDETGKFVVYNPVFLKLFGLFPDSTIKNVNDQDWSQWQVLMKTGHYCRWMTTR